MLLQFWSIVAKSWIILVSKPTVLKKSQRKLPKLALEIPFQGWIVVVINKARRLTIIINYAKLLCRLKNFMPPFYGWGSTVSRQQSHYQETVYFLPRRSFWSLKTYWSRVCFLLPASGQSNFPLFLINLVLIHTQYC